MITRLLRPRTGLALLVTLLVPVWLIAQRSGSTIATDRIFEALGLRAGLTVCEVGAGDGELSMAAARAVGERGRVYTSELGEERVGDLKKQVERSGLPQITVVSGEPSNTNFPEGACDALFMRNVYHHFEDPSAMNASIAAALKPGGRVAIVDFTPRGGPEAERPSDRDEDGRHGVSPESVARELKEAGFGEETSESGDGRWFMVVARKSGS